MAQGQSLTPKGTPPQPIRRSTKSRSLRYGMGEDMIAWRRARLARRLSPDAPKDADGRTWAQRNAGRYSP